MVASAAVVVPTDVVEASIHPRRGCSEAEGVEGGNDGEGRGEGGRGAKFFRGRSYNVPHRLATLALR